MINESTIKKKIQKLEDEIVLVVNKINLLSCDDHNSDEHNIEHYKSYKKVLEKKLQKLKKDLSDK